MRYGSASDQVDRLRVAFAQGEIADLGFEPWPAFEAEPADFKDLIVRKLQTLFKRSHARLQKLTPTVKRNRAGYGFLRSASESGIQLGRLVAGSEGTLAIVLQAALRTVPLPQAQCVVLLSFAALSDAATFVTKRLSAAAGAVSSDLYDRRSVSLARDADASCRAWIDDAAEAILTVEFEGDDPGDVAARARSFGQTARRFRGLVSEPFVTFKRAECERLIGLRRLLEPLLLRFRGRARPVSFIDDIAVPPDRFADILLRMQGFLQQQNITWTLDAYAGDGRLRVRPFLDLADPGDRGKLDTLASAVCTLVIEAGGTISSAQGCGLVRTQFLRRQYGELVQVFREIKDAFDPQNLFNPGKIIGDDAQLMLRDLKPWHALTPEEAPDPVSSWTGLSARDVPPGSGETKIEAEAPQAPNGLIPGTVAELPVIEPALRWSGLSLVETACACHGCGACRSTEPVGACVRASGPFGTKRRHHGRRRISSGCWPPAGSIRDSGGPTNSMPTPICVFIASSAARNVPRGSTSRA